MGAGLIGAWLSRRSRAASQTGARSADAEEGTSALNAPFLLASIVENSDDAIITRSLDDTVTSWNEAAEKLYGYSAAEVVGKPSAILKPAHMLGDQTAAFTRGRGRERTRHFETVRRRKDGALIDVSMSVSVIKNAAGAVVGSSTIARDITEQKRAEAEIRRLNLDLQRRVSEFETLLDLAPVGICITEDPACSTVWANRAMARLLRLPATGEGARVFGAEETAGAKVFSGGQELEPAGQPLQRAVSTGQVVRDVELELRFESGGATRVLSSAAPLFDEQGRVRGGIHTAVDITARSAAEDRLREADLRKNDFLAVLAHELRNPLAALSNALEVLERPGIEPALSDQVRAIAGRQVHHLARLVDDLLDVARIMHGKIELRRTRVELSAAVERAIETAAPAIEAQGHELAVSLPPTPVWIDGDPIRLAQIVSNLLNNSAKYTEPGGKIWLSATASNGSVTVRVKDSGIGISREALPIIWDMFAQAGPLDSRSPVSLGVGLRLVKNLVLLHAGRVEAFSEGPGKGSEFVVTLPTAPPPAAIEPMLVVPTRPPKAVKSRRILVVDDNADAAAGLATLLRLDGHIVETASSGQGALAAVSTYRPEVVFLDIGMPDIDGYEVARQLRATHGHAGLVLIAVTGWGQEQDRQRARESGFDHHLTKPVEARSLSAVLAESRPS